MTESSSPHSTATRDARSAAHCDAPCRVPSSEHHGISRRHFLAQGTAGAIAAVLVSACGDGELGSTTAPTIANGTVRLADFAALSAVGGIARVTLNGAPVAVVRSAADTYRAFSLVCPHQGTTVNITGGSFRCPNHGATFSATGRWTGGQATSNLRELTVTLSAADGTLAIS